MEKSIENGKLENLGDYRIGHGGRRPPPGTTWLPQGRRREFTLQDDQLLWDYMHPYEQVEGFPIKGRKVYEQIALKVITPDASDQKRQSTYACVLILSSMARIPLSHGVASTWTKFEDDLDPVVLGKKPNLRLTK